MQVSLNDALSVGQIDHPDGVGQSAEVRRSPPGKAEDASHLVIEVAETPSLSPAPRLRVVNCHPNLESSGSPGSSGVFHAVGQDRAEPAPPNLRIDQDARRQPTGTQEQILVTDCRPQDLP